MASRLPDGFHGSALAMQGASPELAVEDENEADAMEIYAAVKPSGTSQSSWASCPSCRPACTDTSAGLLPGWSGESWHPRWDLGGCTHTATGRTGPACLS